MKANETTQSYGFQEDSKRYRKLRKLLRQIEHLQLVARPLNDEEKYKCSKRDSYRKELNALNEKYSNSQLLSELKKDENISFEQDESNSHLFLNNSEIEISFTQPNAENNISLDDELNNKLANLTLDTKTEHTDAMAEEENNKNIPSVESNEQINNSESNQETQNNAAQSKKSKKQKNKQPQQQKSQSEVDASNISSTSTAVQPTQTQSQAKLKPKIFYDHFEIENSHEDIIVSMDISIESNLIVTGSRDTTIKVWNLSSGKLVHSFGGHTGPITSVRFWSLKNYLDSIENLKNLNNNDDNDSIPEISLSDEENDLDEDNQEDDEYIQKKRNENTKKTYPFILSSSLDCSFRIWSILKEKCIKQFYLYNPINHFDVSNTSFLIALDAGKIGFIKNMKEISSPKLLSDTDSFRCIKFLDNEQNKFYALTQFGNLILVSIDNENQFEIITKVNLYSIMTNVSSKFTQNFKRFELINNDKLLIINDNQSYVILYDLNNKDTFKLISTNTSRYGFTNCFFRMDNQFYINSFNIDTGVSSLNVFEYEPIDSDFFKYKYTIQDDDLDSYCISAIACSKLEQQENDKTFYTLVTGSNKNIKVWTLQEILVISNNKNRKDQAKYLKMCKELSLHNNQENFSDNDDEDEKSETNNKNVKEHDDDDDENEENKKKGYCSIQ